MALTWPAGGDPIRTKGVHVPFSSGGRLVLDTAPAVEPIEKSDLYLAHKIVTNGDSPETSPDDAFLDIIIAAVRQRAEEVELWRALITQTWKLTLDCFPSDLEAITLSRPPLQSVSSITFLDTAGDSQTLSTDVYQVYAPEFERGYIALKYGQTWPSTRDIQEAVTITFVAGYSNAKGDVPAAIRNWCLVRAGQAYELREGFHPQNWIPANDFVDGLLDPYRLKGVG